MESSRVFPPPKQTDNTLARGIVIWVMPLAVLAHLAMAFLLFDGLTPYYEKETSVALLASKGSNFEFIQALLNSSHEL